MLVWHWTLLADLSTQAERMQGTKVKYFQPVSKGGADRYNEFEKVIYL